MNFTAAVVATCLACPVKAVPASPHSAGAIVNWWGEVRRGLAEGEYHASDDGRGLQAPNRAHDLRTYFEPVGVRVHSRTAVGSPRLVSLLPACLGRGDALVPIAAGTVSHAGARVEIRHPGGDRRIEPGNRPRMDRVEPVRRAARHGRRGRRRQRRRLR